MSRLKSIGAFPKNAIFPKQPDFSSIVPGKNHVNSYEEYEKLITMQDTEVLEVELRFFSLCFAEGKPPMHKREGSRIRREPSRVGGKPPSNPLPPPLRHLFCATHAVAFSYRNGYVTILDIKMELVAGAPDEKASYGTGADTSSVYNNIQSVRTCQDI